MASLIDEIVRHIRATVGPDFGDDGTDEGCKVYSDFAAPQALPYAVAYETGESYSFMTRNDDGIAYLADGQVQLDIYGEGRATARRLGVLIAATLDDAETDLDCEEGRVMMIRVTAARFAPLSDPGPEGAATVFVRSLTIQYQQQRKI